MIRSISVENYRCFGRLNLDNPKRLNVITGDNGVGKTSLLESIFLPLSVGSEVAVRLRQQRGMEALFAATRARIEESLWGDFFHNFDMSKRISLSLKGDGDASRSLVIARGRSGVTLPMDVDGQNAQIVRAPVSFTWTNAQGEVFEVVPSIRQGEISFPDTGEDMPDFFFIPALAVINASENAGRFSELSKLNRQDALVKVFTREFKQIEGMSIEVNAGAPSIFLSLQGIETKVPLPAVSSGINRLLSILLAIASRPRSIVLVDEIENGVYYKHFPFMWKAIVDLLRDNDSQLFAATHSAECLRALTKAMGKETADVALWQVEKIGDEPTVTQFEGARMKSAIESGVDIR